MAKRLIVHNADGKQLKEIKRKDRDRAIIAFILARLYKAVEPAKLERAGRQYSEDMEIALSEIIDAIDRGGEFTFFTDPGKPHEVNRLIDEAADNLRKLQYEIHCKNGEKGIEAAHKTWIEI